MRMVFTKTFPTSSAGEGFEAGVVYDLTPTGAAYWESLGVAVKAPPLKAAPRSKTEIPAEGAPQDPPLDPPGSSPQTGGGDPTATKPTGENP